MEINIELPFIAADANGPKHLKMNFTRTKFNEITSDLVESTIESMRELLKDAKLSLNEIDKVILVGGSARIPAVQEAVRKFTGREPSITVNPDECFTIRYFFNSSISIVVSSLSNNFY